MAIETWGGSTLKAYVVPPLPKKKIKQPRLYKKIVEGILGKKLPEQAVIHHVDKNRKNNDNKNLVVCEDQAYHLFLHVRMKAYTACGNPNARYCRFCSSWDEVGTNGMRLWGKETMHKDCASKRLREYRH